MESNHHGWFHPQGPQAENGPLPRAAFALQSQIQPGCLRLFPMISVSHWRTTGARGKESEGGSRVRCREPLPVDEGQVAAGDPRTETARLPRGAAVRLASPDGVAGLSAL